MKTIFKDKDIIEILSKIDSLDSKPVFKPLNEGESIFIENNESKDKNRLIDLKIRDDICEDSEQMKYLKEVLSNISVSEDILNKILKQIIDNGKTILSFDNNDNYILVKANTEKIYELTNDECNFNEVLQSNKRYNSLVDLLRMSQPDLAVQLNSYRGPSELFVHSENIVTFTNGIHRFINLRYLGAKWVPIFIDEDEKEKMIELGILM